MLHIFCPHCQEYREEDEVTCFSEKIQKEFITNFGITPQGVVNFLMLPVTRLLTRFMKVTK